MNLDFSTTPAIFFTPENSNFAELTRQFFVPSLSKECGPSNVVKFRDISSYKFSGDTTPAGLHLFSTLPLFSLGVKQSAEITQSTRDQKNKKVDSTPKLILYKQVVACTAVWRMKVRRT